MIMIPAVSGRLGAGPGPGPGPAAREVDTGIIMILRPRLALGSLSHAMPARTRMMTQAAVIIKLLLMKLSAIDQASLIGPLASRRRG